MAGDWLKFESSTPDKPEVFAITAAMGWDDPDLTVGKLLRVWRWFDAHTLDGQAGNVTFSLLDRIAGVTGFAKAMADVGWLLDTDGVLTLPNFSRHNGATAKTRSETAKRVASHRSRQTGEDRESRPSEKDVIPRPIRSLVVQRDNNKCVYCGRSEGEFTPPELPIYAQMCLDHVIPESQSGATEPANLVCACFACNSYKAHRTPDECNLAWPTREDGTRYGSYKSVTTALPREEKRREDINTPIAPKGAGKSMTPQTEEGKRICRIMGRRETTAWSSKEVRAFKAIMPIDPADLAAVEAYYAAERNAPDSICRRDLCTLLNNWPGEVDRAHAWSAKRSSQPQRTPLKGPPRREDVLIN